MKEKNIYNKKRSTKKCFNPLKIIKSFRFFILKNKQDNRNKSLTGFTPLEILKSFRFLILKNKQDNRNKSLTGFTLIELLVVIAIIGMLGSIAAGSYTVTKRKANDSRRLVDMKSIQKAMELYINDHFEYPSEEPQDGTWEKSYEDDGNFLSVLTDGGYFSGKTPVDPVNSENADKYYAYFKFPAGANGCDSSKGNYFVLGIRDMETSGNPHPQSPGWSCPGRDFQNDFEWVIGGYEY